ncbi:LPS translocon maturation chaperone LptM [Rhodomicrobium vannielii]|uniref:LPS translocon maturation chaperone LptM n=1 Tax=Rhodomicrobium vannielii TaxID=1069 RepID=UPI000B4AEF6B|nr:hypothetical protein [Rhodomicrobium vannielii]
MSRSLKLMTVLAFATLALSACGKRGVLEPPPDAEVTTPAKKKHNVFGSDSKAEKKPAEPQEHRPFVLDGLLR